ncbi:MAG: Dabb family protein [Pirellulales bacterium]|nr:Dabb family protein [Pirellulales bacterium]
MPCIQHCVLVKFAVGTPQRTIDEFFADLRALVDKLPGISGFTGGADCSLDGLSQGYTHGFVMTFADAATRDVYLPHPDHVAILEKYRPHLDGGLDGVHVLDWYG